MAIKIIHGHARKDKHTATYKSWKAMNNRCKNSGHFKYYKAKNIIVCDEWKTSFVNFLNDMGVRPEGKTLDRIDNFKGYNKTNCRWATPLEQGNNKTNNRILSYKKIKCSITQLAKLFGYSRQTLNYRLKAGMDVITAIETPITRYRDIEINGTKMRIDKWISRYKISKGVLSRLAKKENLTRIEALKKIINEREANNENC